MCGLMATYTVNVLYIMQMDSSIQTTVHSTCAYMAEQTSKWLNK